VTGILYHESVHVWQWGLQDYAAHWWVFEGIADFVRLNAGYAPAHWVKPGQGSSWDKGYDVTARFLDYCDGLCPGFVAMLSAKLKDGCSDDYFVQILGKCLQELCGSTTRPGMASVSCRFHRWSWICANICCLLSSHV
jgi:hypothetical protein